jgi:hypothetical protein
VYFTRLKYKKCAEPEKSEKMENDIPLENQKNVIILSQLLKVYTKYRNNGDGNTASAQEVYAPRTCLSLLIRVSNIYIVLEGGGGALPFRHSRDKSSREQLGIKR